jgi:hypothetical protein
MEQKIIERSSHCLTRAMDILTRISRLPISWSSFYEFFFPQEEKRMPLTAKEVPSILCSMVSLLLLAYLARRPNTRLIRIAIMPPTLIWIIRAGTAYQWWPPEYYKAYNCLVGASLSSVGLGYLMKCRDRSRVHCFRWKSPRIRLDQRTVQSGRAIPGGIEDDALCGTGSFDCD